VGTVGEMVGWRIDYSRIALHVRLAAVGDLPHNHTSAKVPLTTLTQQPSS